MDCSRPGANLPADRFQSIAVVIACIDVDTVLKNSCGLLFRLTRLLFSCDCGVILVYDAVIVEFV